MVRLLPEVRFSFFPRLTQAHKNTINPRMLNHALVLYRPNIFSHAASAATRVAVAVRE